MSESDPLEYAPPPAAKPTNAFLVMLPLVFTAGPVLIAFCCFSFGYRGMALAAIFLLLGMFVSPAAAILATINCIRYWRKPSARYLSLLAILMAAAAYCFELWRITGEWD